MKSGIVGSVALRVSLNTTASHENKRLAIVSLLCIHANITTHQPGFFHQKRNIRTEREREREKERERERGREKERGREWSAHSKCPVPWNRHHYASRWLSVNMRMYALAGMLMSHTWVAASRCQSPNPRPCSPSDSESVRLRVSLHSSPLFSLSLYTFFLKSKSSQFTLISSSLVCCFFKRTAGLQFLRTHGSSFSCDPAAYLTQVHPTKTMLQYAT